MTPPFLQRARPALAILLLLTAATSGSAQPIARDISPRASTRSAASLPTRGMGLVLEEDLPQFSPVGINQDRNYTGGGAFLFSGDFLFNRPIAKLTTLFEHWVRLDRLPAAEILAEGEQTALGVTAFTPDSLYKRAIEYGDRPYASLTLISHRRMHAMADGRTAYWSEVAVGALGLHLARNGQRWIHKKSRASSGKPTPYDPKGWSHQISDGGEPTTLVSLSVERLLLNGGDPASQHWFDATAKATGNVGYYTDFAGGTNLRLGLLNSSFWAFSSSALGNASRATRASPSARRRGPDAFVFLQGRGRASAYNALLQGQFASSDYTVERYRRLTAEWDAGVAARIPIGSRDLRFAWSMQSGRTSELYGAFSRTHTWGSISATYVAPLVF